MATQFSTNAAAKVTMYRGVVYANALACKDIEFPFGDETVELEGDTFTKIGDEDGTTYKSLKAFSDDCGIELDGELDAPKPKRVGEQPATMDFSQTFPFISNAATKALALSFFVQNGRAPVITITGTATQAKVRNDKGTKGWAATPVPMTNVLVTAVKAKWLFCHCDGKHLYVKAVTTETTVSFN